MSPAVFLLVGLLLLWLVFTGRLTATWLAITGQGPGAGAASPVRSTTPQAVGPGGSGGQSGTGNGAGG